MSGHDYAGEVISEIDRPYFTQAFADRILICIDSHGTEIAKLILKKEGPLFGAAMTPTLDSSLQAEEEGIVRSVGSGVHQLDV